MSRYCPVLKRNVVYLVCLECEEEECLTMGSAAEKREEEIDSREICVTNA